MKRSLRANGYVVIPFLNKKEIDSSRMSILSELKTAPEYAKGRREPTETQAKMFRLRNTDDKVLKMEALGGFAALGMPSSWHCSSIRRVREWMFSTLFPLMEEMRKESGHEKIEFLPDRFMLRNRRYQAPTAESWHRDNTEENEQTHRLESDDIFGTFANLDHESQYFCCVAGSHTRGKVLPGGFDTVEKEEAERLTKRMKRGEIPDIEIPAGHMIVFYQNIVHCVKTSSKTKDETLMMRLFAGVRLTNDSEPLLKNIEELLEAQGPIPMKSGQRPPMFASMHQCFRPDWVHKFSLKFREECLDEKSTHEVSIKGQGKMTVHGRKLPRFMRSLEKMGLPKHGEYSDFEKLGVVSPSREFYFRAKGSDVRIRQMCKDEPVCKREKVGKC